jgi:hypothetical protein
MIMMTKNPNTIPMPSRVKTPLCPSISLIVIKPPLIELFPGRTRGKDECLGRAYKKRLFWARAGRPGLAHYAVFCPEGKPEWNSRLSR